MLLNLRVEPHFNSEWGGVVEYDGMSRDKGRAVRVWCG